MWFDPRLPFCIQIPWPISADSLISWRVVVRWLSSSAYCTVTFLLPQDIFTSHCKREVLSDLTHQRYLCLIGIRWCHYLFHKLCRVSRWCRQNKLFLLQPTRSKRKFEIKNCFSRWSISMGETTNNSTRQHHFGPVASLQQYVGMHSQGIENSTYLRRCVQTLRQLSRIFVLFEPHA